MISTTLQIARWILGAVPTFVVFLLLGGIAYWGHTHGWSLAAFSEAQTESAKPDWCSEHHVPESLCIECKPELDPRGADYGWCREHGIHNCPLCHPELAQLPSTPEVESAKANAKNGLALRPRPENNNRCLLYRRRIQFVSEEAIAKAGVDIGLAETRPVVETIEANAEIRYDQRRVARLSSRTSGSVWRVEKEIGQRVRAGELLALVDSAEVGKAKVELLQAFVRLDLEQKNVNRLEPLLDRGATSEAGLLQAKADLREAQARLVGAQQTLANLGLPMTFTGWEGSTPEQLQKRIRFLGLSESLANSLEGTSATANLIPIYAPFDGIVADRQVVAGEVVDPTKLLFTVVDPRQMWLILDIPHEDIPYVKLGQTVHFQTNVAERVTGKITWISTETDEHTRTIRARAELDNAEGTLRAMTFGSAHIVLREEEAAIAVPSEAIQWDGSCHVVFVRDKHYFDKETAKLFHVRTIRPGVKADGYTEVIAGVLPGEVVATKGSGVLRGQLLRSNLGAG